VPLRVKIFIFLSSEISSWPQPQAWPQDQTAYDQQQQHAVYPAWQPNEDYQQRIYDLEQQVAELRSSLESSDSTRQSLELELPRLKEEKERRIKGLEDQLIFLQTSFDAANLAKQSLEMELSQLPNW
jgi:cell division septum initiation protein DivIVA